MPDVRGRHGLVDRAYPVGVMATSLDAGLEQCARPLLGHVERIFAPERVMA